MVDPASDRVSRAPPYSGTASTSPIYFAYGGFTLCARLSQNLSAINRICNLSVLRRCSPSTPLKGLGSSNFARRYFRNLRRIAPLLDFFSLCYLDGSLHLVWLYYPILFRYRNDDISVAGLPHSAIRESLNVCFSSRLFAAYHGLLRLSAPLGIHHKPFSSLDHIIVPSFSSSKRSLLKL